MTYAVRYTAEARRDLRHLYGYLVQQDPQLARRARDTISRGIDLLKDFPFACRKVSQNNPFLRELLVSFGSSGFVVLFEVEDAATVTILALRHQRQDDFF